MRTPEGVGERTGRPLGSARANPDGVQGNVVSPGVNELIIPNYKQTWAAIRKVSDAPEAVRHLSFKSFEYAAG